MVKCLEGFSFFSVMWGGAGDLRSIKFIYGV